MDAAWLFQHRLIICVLSIAADRVRGMAIGMKLMMTFRKTLGTVQWQHFTRVGGLVILAVNMVLVLLLMAGEPCICTRSVSSRSKTHCTRLKLPSISLCYTASQSQSMRYVTMCMVCHFFHGWGRGCLT